MLPASRSALRTLRVRPRNGAAPCLALVLALLALALGCRERDELASVREMQSEGRVEESIDALQKLVDAGDRRPEVLFRYAQALLYMGDSGRAIWSLEAVIGDPKYTVEAARQLAFVALSGGNPDLALRTLDRLAELRTDGDAETDVAALLLEARALLESRRSYPQALEVVERILDLEPANQEALRYRVAALIGDRRTDEAFKLIRDLAGESKDDSDLYVDTGEGGPYWCSIAYSFHRDDGALDEAERVARECHDRYADDPGALTNLLDVLALEGKRQEALTVLEEVYAEAPYDRSLRKLLTLHLRNLQREDEAEKILRDAVAQERKQDPIRPEALATLIGDLGRFLVDRDRLDEGLEAFDEVMRLIGDRATPDFMLSYAEALFRSGRYDDALAIAGRTPVEVHQSMIRGRVAYERADYEGAIRELESASRIWPDNATIRYYIALSCEAMGNFDRASDEYRQALRADRAFAPARIRLARLHFAERRWVQASAIMMLAPPQENALESLAAKRIEVAIQIGLARPVDLSVFPQDPKWPLDVIQAACVRTIGDVLRARDGAKNSVDALMRQYENAPPAFAPLFLIEIVESLIASDQPQEAVKRARTAFDKRGSGDPRYALALGRALATREATGAEAERILKQAADEEGSAPARLWLAEIASRAGRTDEAIDRYGAVVDQPGLETAAITGLARALVASGRAKEAASRLEAYLLEVDPYDGRAALELARVSKGLSATKERCIELASRALRFGAGEAALAMLRDLDPVRFKEKPVAGG